MSGPSTSPESSGESTSRPVPEYELEQYFPERTATSAAVRRRIRRRYGRVRAFFRLRPDRFGRLQRSLNQARMGTNYDVYLTRSVWFSLAAAVLGGLLGALLAVQLARAGVFGQVQSPVSLPGGLGAFVSANEVVLGVAAVTLVSGTLFGAGTFLVRYLYPRSIVNSRQRSINVVLPNAIVYMYALAYGGMKPMDVFEEVAEAEDIYGEVAREFELIVNDVEVFGNDMITAVQNARNVTPNENLEQFFDDMLSILDSGSDFTQFLEEESRSYRAQAEEEQESFLQTLSILSEVFIVAFVAAPLFLIVTLVLVSLLGGESLSATYALVYAVLPLGMVGFLVTVDYLSAPFSQVSSVSLGVDRGDVEVDLSEAVTASPLYRRYRRRKYVDAATDLLRHPVRTVLRTGPLVSVILTGPVAVALAALAYTGTDPLFALPGTADAVRQTINVAVLPAMVVVVPLGLFYEAERLRRRRIVKAFPDTLNILASANQMGISLTEALDLVARWSEGVIARELRKVRNDIRWNNDVEQALLAMGARLEVPRVMRTTKLIAKGSQSTSDLSRVLGIAAEETRSRHRLERQRRQEMNAYIAIVVIGFLVYLGVVVMVHHSFLQPIAELGEQASDLEAGGPLPDVGDLPVETYQMVFFHSALIQGVGSGLLAGKLAENELLAGLKYGVALVTITVAVFLLL